MTKVLDSRLTPTKDAALGGAIGQLQKLIEEDKQTRIEITLPAQGASLVLPIDMEATWTHPIKPGTFRAEVNGKDVTSLFSVDEAAMKAWASWVRVGDPVCAKGSVEDMTLVVSAQMRMNLPKPGYYLQKDSRGFTIAGPAYAVVPNATELHGSVFPGQPYYLLDVIRGSTAIVRIAVAPFNGFLSDVVITADASRAPLPPVGSTTPGITFNTPLAIKAGADHDFLRIAVDSKVDCGDYSVALISTAPADFDHGEAQIVAVALTVHPSS